MFMSFISCISTLTMGYGTRRPVRLRIRWCGEYDERQGIACTSHGANFAGQSPGSKRILAKIF